MITYSLARTGIPKKFRGRSLIQQKEKQKLPATETAVVAVAQGKIHTPGMGLPTKLLKRRKALHKKNLEKQEQQNIALADARAVEAEILEKQATELTRKAEKLKQEEQQYREKSIALRKRLELINVKKSA